MKLFQFSTEEIIIIQLIWHVHKHTHELAFKLNFNKCYFPENKPVPKKTNIIMHEVYVIVRF